jgi:enamine deaminase RidA (YjgF/YER057c/UK114 family)
MSAIRQRLDELGLILPPAPPPPVAAYLPALVSGGMVFVAGQIPFFNGKLLATGPVPSVTSLEAAQHAAAQCALNALAAAGSVLDGDLDRISRIVRLGVFVASDAGFFDQPKVANGASELLHELFGEAGRHVRAAVGCIALPLNASVEVEMIIEVR